MTRAERFAFIERTESELPLTMQNELLSLSRSSLYYQPRPPSAEEVQLKHRIDEVYTQARQALTRYFTFYNHERLHRALDYQTPAELYFHKP